MKQAFISVLLISYAQQTPPPSRAPAGDIQVHRDLGKAYYERAEYDLAVRELGRVLELDGAQARDAFNFGMALLQSADEDGALAAFTTARQMDPDLIAVDFGLGVLYKRQLRDPLALEAFQRVLARDPEDPGVWFNIGAVSQSMEKWEDAARAFERVLDMGFARAQNFYVSALFRLAALRNRANRNDEAKRLLDEFRTLRPSLPNVTLTTSALESGKYGEILVPIGPAATPVRRDTPSVFTLAEEVRFSDQACSDELGVEPSLALGDFDGDGRTDVFVANPCGANRLFRNGGGGWVDVTQDAGLSGSKEAVGALFLDDGNSKFVSLLVLEKSAVRLYRNREGRFSDAGMSAGIVAEPAGPSAGGLTFDYDNDGQLDVLLSGVGDKTGDIALRLYRNHGDGSFEDATERAGLQSTTIGRPRGAGFGDFDENGFADLLVVTDSSEALLFSNPGSGHFEGTSLSLEGGPAGRLGARVLTDDFNHDGWVDAFVLDERGYGVWINRSGKLEPVQGLPSLTPHPERWAMALDADRNGRSDFLLRDHEGRFRLLSRGADDRFDDSAVEIPEAAKGFATWADLEANGAVQILTVGSDGLMRVLKQQSPPDVPWLVLRLEGLKSNRQAVGALVEVKSGLSYQKRIARGLPLTVFVPDSGRVHVVRVTWSNGVIQNEVDVATNQALEIVEAERQTSSCPFLYVWDGERFRFLTDVLGRAPLGEPLPAGGWVQPNPDDYVRVPPGAIEQSDGRYVFQVTEELKEIAYLDSVELLVVDHPRQEELYANERFSAPPFEPFRLYPVGDRRAPLRATDGHGQDVLDRLLDADGRYVDGFSPRRITGLAEEHALVLDPGDWPGDSPLLLFLSGWVYWASSSSMKALSSHGGESFLPPVLEVRDRQGRWVRVSDDLGLPSGLHRTLVVDLTDKLLSEDRSVRIRTNLRVYWDHAFFATATQAKRPTVHVLEPSSADLHYRGFSVPYRRGHGATPELFDYDRRLAEAPWNAPDDLYTRFGDVRSLIEKADDRLVVMAPGDELTLVYDGKELPPEPEGWARDYFIHLTGWAKDTDSNTAFFRSVEPLPQRGMKEYAALGLEGSAGERLRTRRVSSLVAPLRLPSTR